MNVVQVVKSFPPAIGGVENHVYHLSLELCRRGHRVSVLTSEGNVKNAEEIQRINRKLRKRNAKVYRLKKLSTGLSPSIINSHYTFFMPSAIPRLLSTKANIVHAHSFPSLHADISGILSRVRGIPFVLKVHGLHRLHRFYNAILGKKILSLAKRVIVNNPYQAHLLRRMGVKGEKIRAIPPGIHVERFRKSYKSSFKDRYGIWGRIILFVGRIVRGKGLKQLVKAAPKVLKRFSKSRFVIVGRDLGFGRHLKKLIVRRGLQSHFVFTGPKRERELVKAYNSCDVFVLPSKHEGFGIAALEAMACGKPAVITDYEGSSWFKRSGACRIVRRGKPRELARALVALLSKEALIDRMSERAEEFAQNFDWSLISKKIERVYLEALAECAG